MNGKERWLNTECPEFSRLDHHRDEVWFASISHDGRLLATSSKEHPNCPVFFFGGGRMGWEF